MAGAIIGTVMAFSSYRMVYAGIWDWRVNHIPLNRAVPLSGAGAELENAVFTRQAGWGGGVRGYGEKHVMGGGNGGRVGTGNGHGCASSPSRKPVGSGHHARVGSDNIV